MTPSRLSDTGYEARVDELYDALVDLVVGRRDDVGATARELAAELGWRGHEVRAKLMQLRRRGVAIYNRGSWWPVA